MSREPNASSLEHYVMESGRYVLYIGRSRILASSTIAVLLDTRLGRLITHGDPQTVRRELDAMRQASCEPGAGAPDRDWLLLEGHPRLEPLNRALRGCGGLRGIRQAFAGGTRQVAHDATNALLQRLAGRKPPR